MSESLLKIEKLSIDYAVKGGELSAVDDLSLDIAPGEVFALVGESGCGKSTVSSAIMRLLDKESARVTGRILFEQKDLLALTEPEMEKLRGRQLGMIFQNPLDALNPVYRTGDQVAEALMLDGLTRKQAMARALELYQMVRIPDAEKRLQSYPHEMSGGMRQRVMIAMMLARNPKLLIADEPTTALDVTIEAQILDILLEMRKRYNASILLITHNFGVVAETADRVGVMYAGHLVEIGDVYTIFKEPKHPYTQALIAALPSGSKREKRLSVIPGSVPRILDHQPGCRFANRCPYADERCRTQDPPAVRYGDGHEVRCHRKEG